MNSPSLQNPISYERQKEHSLVWSVRFFLPIRTKNLKYVNRWSWERREEVGKAREIFFLADYGWGSWEFLGSVYIGIKVHGLRYATLRYATLCKWAVGG